MKRFLFFCAFTATLIAAYAAALPSSKYLAKQKVDYPPLLFEKINKQDLSRWVADKMNSMTLEEKVGQLIMPVIYPSADARKIQEAERLVRNRHIGGILFQKGKLADQYTMTQKLQEVARTPLLIALDGEWGLYMRLKDAPRFPRNMGLGQLKDNQILYNYGREIARECRLMGIHINFAPVLDVNNNPKNPVIGTRSFGDDPRQVAAKGTAYAQGLEDGGVMAVAKHFPGHGNTSEDSHKTLPMVLASRHELEKTELYPFAAFFHAGLSGVMTAHLNVPAIEPQPNTPSSLSYAVCTELLQKKMGFKGLIFTDGLAMQGVQTAGKNPVSVRAILAGNDILLGPIDPNKAFTEVLQAIREGTISEELLEEKCRKILAYKYALIIERGVAGRMSAEQVVLEVNNREAKRMQEILWQSSISFQKNKKHLLPLSEKSKVACLSIGETVSNSFRQTAGLSANDCYTLAKGSSAQRIRSLLSTLKRYDVVVAAIRQSHVEWAESVLRQVAEQQPTALVFFTTPYTENGIKKAGEKAQAVVMAYEHTQAACRAAAIRLWGKEREGVSSELYDMDADGEYDPTAEMMPETPSLPVEKVNEPLISELMPMPEVDRIAEEALRDKAFPGCRIMAIYRDKVVYNKSFGTLDGSLRGGKVSDETIYDLASLTKALATTPAVMLLVDEGKLKLTDRLGKVLPRFADTALKNITIRDLLLHQSGVRPSINFYQSLIDENSLQGSLYSYRRAPNLVQIDRHTWGNPFFEFRSDLVSHKYQTKYPIRFSSDLYISEEVKDIVLDKIASTPLRGIGRYKYSDVGFILLQQVVEKISGESLDEFTQKRIFTPIGAQTLGYLPLKRFSAFRIAPTQNDKFLRKSVVRGTVDDESAACLGGVSGNAGVFGTAEDVARVLKMFIHEGSYMGKKIIDRKVFHRFITTTGRNDRRCLGFDKERAGMAESASPSTYGHTGFTGTCFWVDPDNGLIFVFLSNRTYPSRLNKKLISEGIRPKLHQAIYDALGIA